MMSKTIVWLLYLINKKLDIKKRIFGLIIIMKTFMQTIIHDLLTTISNLSSKFSSNSEADVAELLDDLVEMFPGYYMHSDMLSMFKSSTINKRVKHINEQSFLPT